MRFPVCIVAAAGLAAACIPSRTPRAGPVRAADGASPAEAGAGAGGKIYLSDQIIRSGATDVWDFLQRQGSFRLVDGTSSEAGQIESRRGRSSIYLSGADVPIVVLDGTRLVDARYLKSLPADHVFSVRIISGIEGTTYEGTNAGAGVIYVLTKRLIDD